MDRLADQADGGHLRAIADAIPILAVVFKKFFGGILVKGFHDCAPGLKIILRSRSQFKHDIADFVPSLEINAFSSLVVIAPPASRRGPAVANKPPDKDVSFRETGIFRLYPNHFRRGDNSP